ncbi:MAG: hypothetical protein II140_00865 [Paludibacteraceae bacterium]|nr:hypothetical protein [Paludibacteraceae bacterium]
MRTMYSFVLAACLVMGSVAPVVAREAEEEEPVVITAPDTVIEKTAYTLSEQGITIEVSYGSAYPAGHSYNNIDRTYFACLANGNMTIRADRAIQGIAINGWVKKNFSASCDYGTIDYMSDEYDDAIAEPVLTVSDIRNPSVTITCINQLRCFSVEVYFFDNPGSVHEEATDTVRLTMVSAAALDYSEDPTYSTEGAYSYWLALAPAEGYPQIWLDMYAAVKGDLSGEYSLYDYNVGDYTYIQLSANELDYEYAYDQAFVISKSGETYHIAGYIIADNDVQYEFVYDGPIALVPVTEEGVEEVRSDDVLCTKKLINGQLIIQLGDHLYTPIGQQLR